MTRLQAGPFNLSAPRLPARGCALFLDPAQPIVFVPLPGTVAFDLPVNPGLVGAHLAAQAFAGPSAPLGFDLSNGLTLTLGN